MMQGFRLLSYDRPDRQAQAAAMEVMARAFDPLFGEAWNGAQLAGMMAMEGSTLTLARLDGATLGFSLVRSIFDEAELLLLAVDPAWRRRSVGSALLQQCFSTARLRSIRSMHLEVRATNKAIELYKKAGFEHVNTRPGYYRGNDGQLYDALSFRYEL